MFLFQKDFLGLPDSKVTKVGSSALECSIELNWVPSAITRSFAASLIFTINLDYPPITNQLRKNGFSLKVTKVNEKGPISLYFVFNQDKNNMVEEKSREEQPPFDVAMGTSAGDGHFASRAKETGKCYMNELASLPVTILNNLFFFIFFSSCSFFFSLSFVFVFLYFRFSLIHTSSTFSAQLQAFPFFSN